MSKRKIIVDGEVKLVSHQEWLKHQSQPKKKIKAESKKTEPNPVSADQDPISWDPENNEGS